VVAPFGGPTSSGMLTLHCPTRHIYGLASFMRERGAESIVVAEIEYVFAPDNPLYAKLVAGL
jgi:ATP phosphoribosyltransferase